MDIAAMRMSGTARLRRDTIESYLYYCRDSIANNTMCGKREF